MGYTHYWYRRKEYDPERFGQVVIDMLKVRKALLEAGVPIAGRFGHGDPEINADEIAFNGLEHCGHQERDLGITWPAKAAAGGVAAKVEEDPVVGGWFGGASLNRRACDGNCSHETFALPRVFARNYSPEGASGLLFDCCKTAYKPYDLAVTCALVIAKHHLGDEFKVHSDGDEHDWDDARAVCQNVLGYGAGFHLDHDEA